MKTERTKEKITCTWTKADIKAVAKKLKVTLTDAEVAEVFEDMDELFGQLEFDPYIKEIIENVHPSKQTASTASSMTAAKDPACKWYYHSSSSKNETKAAIAAALDGNHPLLVMACKPACDVCALVWKNLKATTKLADYLKAKGIVGIKIDDTSKHFTDLAKDKNPYTGIDGVSGKKINSTAPFFVFFKVKESARGKSKITLDDTQVELFLSGFGGAKSSAKTYESLTAWLDSIMNKSDYKKAF